MSMWKQREAAAAAKRAAEQKEAELAAAKKKAAREMVRACVDPRLQHVFWSPPLLVLVLRCVSRALLIVCMASTRRHLIAWPDAVLGQQERAEAELAAQKARLQQQQQQAKLNGGKENTSKQQQPQLATRDRERLDSATEAMQLLEKTGVLASAASASSQAKQQQGGSDSRRSALENALERLNSLILGF